MKHRFFALIVLAALALISVFPLAAQDSAFPVTIEHQYGTTTIDAPPQRVVSIGYTEQDALLALGVTPVAVRYWYGEEDAILPWAEDLVEGDAPVVLNMTYGSLNYEAILALQPDLISAVTAGITQEEYDLLSQIAPTITQTSDYINLGMPWQDVTRMIGAAVGQSEQAEEVVTEVEGLFADARATNPQFEGKTIAVFYNYNGDTYGFYTAQDSRGRFFTELGFVVPEELVETAGELFYADLSTERIDLLDQDLIAIVNLQFIEGGREALEADPLFAQLEAVQDGRVAYFDEMVENAMGFSSPLSLAYALEAALPQLETIFPPTEASAAITCEAGFRLIDHAYGELCVPETPENVVALDLTVFELMLVAGVQPAAQSSIAVQSFYQRAHPELLDEIEAWVGDLPDFGFPPNFEVIAAAQPDLIIGVNDLITEDVYAALSQIAPTVVLSVEPGDWRERMVQAGDTLNIAEEVERLLAEYAAREAEFVELVPDAADIELSLVRTFPGQVGVMLTGSIADRIVTDIGLSRAEAQIYDLEYVLGELGGRAELLLSRETLSIADGDVVFVFGDPEELFADPLWGALDAVGRGDVHEVGYYWYVEGLISAHDMLDDLFTYIAQAESTVPNPFEDGLTPPE